MFKKSFPMVEKNAHWPGWNTVFLMETMTTSGVDKKKARDFSRAKTDWLFNNQNLHRDKYKTDYKNIQYVSVFFSGINKLKKIIMDQKEAKSITFWRQSPLNPESYGLSEYKESPAGRRSESDLDRSWRLR